MTLRFYILVAMIMLVATGETIADDAARVAEAWAKREERIRTCRWEWTETDFYPKNSSLYEYMGDGDPKARPNTDLTVHANCTLLLEGKKCRYEYHGQTWSTKEKKLSPFVQVITLDGQKVTTSTLKHSVANNPQVDVTKGPTTAKLRVPKILPVLLGVKPSLVRADIPMDEFITNKHTVSVNGRGCLSLQRKISSLGRGTLFIDLERDAQVVRLAYSHKDVPVITLNISNTRHESLGWLATNWTVVLCENSGQLTMSTKCNVTKFECNIDIDATMFDPVVPIGSRVIDLTSGRELHHAILPDGVKGRQIEYSRGKKSISYDELISQPPQRSSAWVWWLSGIAGVAVLVVVYRVIRNRLVSPKIS